MLVYIAGSGAMGCTIGYHIQKNTESEVILLDYWQEHIDQINKNGLEVTGKIEDRIEIQALKPPQASRKADLIIVMTKSMKLDSMMQDIAHLTSEKTQILCLLNGMGHETILKKHVNLDQINMGVTVWAAGINGPGYINISGIGSIDVQNIGGNEEEGRKVADLLDDAKLYTKYDSNVMHAIWRKVMVNGTMNSTSALLECKIGEFFSTDAHKKIVDDLVNEFVEVGNADGIELDKKEMLDYIYQTSESAKDHYPSMYQDLVKNNKKTEIDFINGAVVEKGKKHNISTPYNDLITQLVHAKEELQKAE
ncbi:2-dehydropantoate 2-reductase [uncultured Anaerococcus sp.]|uniref:2-dehydropantoate 2-reductase n=1 Tax=uncultured Anaerococcus sp. TaxID=293428 RepID=UPI0025FB59DE|nr:2-dehydropantoate 2-reductase [uncultured Anaerococcus sp.]